MESCLFSDGEAIVKQYTQKKFRLIGIGYLQLLEREKVVKGMRCEMNDVKISQSLSRTRSNIYELAICNEWQYFVTLTLNSDIRDRKSLDTFKKQFTKWLNNYNTRKNTQIKYLLIPEPHKDGAWHMHGFFMGIPQDHIREFTLKDRIPNRLKDYIKKGRKLYDWPLYSKSFGWVVMELIRNHEACAAYITKYVTKDIIANRVSLNDHLYYCSLGLKRAQVCYRDTVRVPFEADFKNEFVAIKECDTLDEAMRCFDLDNPDWLFIPEPWEDGGVAGPEILSLFRKPFEPIQGVQLKLAE